MLAAPELSPHWTWSYFAYFGGVCSVGLNDYLLLVVVDEFGLTPEHIQQVYDNERERERDLTVRMNPVGRGRGHSVIGDITVILSSDFQ